MDVSRETLQAPGLANWEECKLLSLYSMGGPSKVFDWVRTHRPFWPWAWCEPCEESTPTWHPYDDDICAVCWSERDRTEPFDPIAYNLTGQG